MPPRIAIPFPHSEDAEYANRAFPQYAKAVEIGRRRANTHTAGSAARRRHEINRSCNAVLLPGSKADIDPAKYKAPPIRRPRPPIPDATRLTSSFSRMPTKSANPFSASATDCKF